MKQKQRLPAFELGKKAQNPPAITFEQPDGSSLAIGYEEFRTVRYFPEGRLERRFAAVTVALHGRNLLPLWRAIRSRRVRLLRVDSAAPETERSDTEPHIDSISIADRAVKA